MKNNRFNFIINKRFQFMVISGIIFLSLMIGLIYFVTIFEFYRGLELQARSAGLNENHVFFNYLSTQKQNLNTTLIITTVLIFLLSLIAGILLSHKVAGPIYKLTNILNEETPQTVSKIQFRKGDFFPELAEAFNKFIQK